MEIIIKTGLLGLFFGTIGTTIGGIIGAFIKENTKKIISFILELASGLMISIVCFDLVPEALEVSNIIFTLVGIMFGVITMFILEELIENKTNKANENSLIKTGIIVGIGLALHNFPEGLAIGAGFSSSIKLGYKLAIAILLHDIPEGLAMAVPLKYGGMKKRKIIFYTMFSGATTGLGSLFGIIISNISNIFIGISLAFAAGAMLYIVSGELIPESKKMYTGRISILGNILGFLLGIITLYI